MKLPKELNPLVVVVSRNEVETQDTTVALNVLNRFIQSPETARECFERIEISFHGYDDDARELFEIDDVRNYVFQLDDQFPYWLFFLSKYCSGLQCLLLSLLPPYLNEEGRQSIFPERISQILLTRWFPAMNQICEFAGFSEEEVERLTERASSYIAKGPFRFEAC